MVISNRELPSVLAGNYAINPTTLQLMFADAEEFQCTPYQLRDIQSACEVACAGSIFTLDINKG